MQIVIVGASSGIGLEMAKIYAARKLNLVLIARRRDRLEEITQYCIELGANAHHFVADFNNLQEIENAYHFTKSTFGGCDTLILSLGVLSVLPFEDIDTPTVSKIFQTNTISPILSSYVFLPMLKDTKGRIVVVSSIGAVFSAPTRALYCSTKHAINGFFNSLRVELEYTGISIIIAMPGTVDTDLRSSALDADPVLSARIKKPSMKPDECARLIVNASDKRRRQIYLPWYYRPLFWFNVYFPEIVDSFTAKMYGYSKKSS